ncbi:MAG: hypothetical protein Q7T12_05625 [Flavobacterium sp.]|nr:hypothetical protein [Flavobacterium sp.]
MINTFYNLSQIHQKSLTDLKPRMLRYRLRKLLEKGTLEIGNLLNKDKQGSWLIHISLVKHFQPIRKRATHTRPKYINEITINLKDNYDVKFYELLGKTITDKLLPHDTFYSVEESTQKLKDYHIHFITSANINDINIAIINIEIEFNINILKNKNTLITPIRDLEQILSYINKACITSSDFIPSSNLI